MRWLVSIVVLLGGGCSGPSVGDCGVLPGALVITELGVRGDPYVEVYAREDVQLSAVSLAIAGSGDARDITLTSDALAAGSYMRFDVSALPDDGGLVVLRCTSTDDVIDTVTYARTPAEVLALDGSQLPDAASNDVATMWCAQAASPGAANARCPLSGCDIGDARTPVRGEVLVSEVLGNPRGADGGQEWVELFIAADEDIALGGLTLLHQRVDTSSRSFALDCEIASAGSYAVVRPEGLALYNSAETSLSVVADNGEVVDAVGLPSLAHDGEVAVRADPSSTTFCLVPQDAATPGAAGACPDS